MALERVSAFSCDPSGGNPAGVWVGDQLPSPAEMQKIAADIGYSETAFIAPQSGPIRQVRYFSPQAEVPFCGHATIASGAVLGQSDGPGSYTFTTSVGDVPVLVEFRDNQPQVSLTSVEPTQASPSDALIDEALSALAWARIDLDTKIAPMKAFAGAWHLVLAVNSLRRLNLLHYQFEELKALMLRENLTTLQLIWRESDTVFHSRNPFPVGGVIEDPATGAAAAALGGYLRDARLIESPSQFIVRQGEKMGRPSVLTVGVPAKGGIVVSGTAVWL